MLPSTGCWKEMNEAGSAEPAADCRACVRAQQPLDAGTPARPHYGERSMLPERLGGSVADAGEGRVAGLAIWR